MMPSYDQGQEHLRNKKDLEAVGSFARALMQENDDRAIKPLANLGTNGLGVLGHAMIKGNKKAQQALEEKAAAEEAHAALALKHAKELMRQRSAA